MHKQSSTIARTALRGIAIAACLAAVSAHAVSLKIKVENVSASDGLWFTPVFFGFHDGSSDFDTFDPGLPATTSIEDLAEEGNPGGLIADFAAAGGAKTHVLLQDGSGAPPGVLFAPGESNHFTIDLDTSLNRYLSFAAMLLPSNDAFFANASQTGYELFDMAGNFNGAFEINLFGSNIWDAGTEENNFLGQPFSPLPGSIDTIGGSVSLLGQAGVDGFAGAGVGPTMSNLASTLDVNDQIARISIEEYTPKAVPDSTQYIGFMGAIALIGFRFISRKRMGKSAA
ncbi:hypothetical protein VDG1235_4213 [Verrucomicrobiia bacterium DG1235]|nr:hypothetical protein VDG1235_4213 [Verrucomicrobiae bacterium DG1235]